ncbi:high molecular mass early light-inducible protein HV58, chloroplastic-like [Triticum dicoccoides]|uniref:high molecular mass early light-inducible protein HV58, chloroplastic-like n=1 Tax=Triticum dicoccoides TaxID=85692 RepID=UPI00188F6043|nr:high molecular mass early light-inducible protein HV58, chloroplastic-like [Triticum dicoccoides]
MATMVTLSSFAVVGRSAARSPVVAPRRRALVVRAQAEPDMDSTKETTSASTSSSPRTSPAPTPIPAAPKPMTKKANPSVWDALAFSGPAPERTNGRLAMVGFVAALSVEAARGGGLLDQAGSGAGLGWFLVTAGVFSVASLVPLLQGQSVESKSSRVWSADAELWNGRFAMLGLVALAATEFITGAPFVNI